jgi:hypothetical protein
MKPHRTDGVSLSFGLIFLAVAVWWAIAQVTAIKLPALGWLAAGALILFGVVGVLSAIRSGRRAEVTAPVQAEVGEQTAEQETPGGLPPELHADIVRELLENPADRPLPEPSTPPAAAGQPSEPGGARRPE